MFFEESSTRWILILFEFVIGLILYFGSKSQPFPAPSRKLGILILMMACLFLLGQTAPRPATVNGHLTFLSLIGAFGLLFGVHHMLRTRREVLVAPMSGFLFSVEGRLPRCEGTHLPFKLKECFFDGKRVVESMFVTVNGLDTHR